jgi:hypothetical protein
MGVYCRMTSTLNSKLPYTTLKYYYSFFILSKGFLWEYKLFNRLSTGVPTHRCALAGLEGRGLEFIPEARLPVLRKSIDGECKGVFPRGFP